MAAAEGFTFTFTEGASQLSDAFIADLASRTDPVPVRSHRMRLFEAYADRSGRPFRTTLRRRDGDIVSYCCGFLGQDAGYLLHQLNDRVMHRVGPSLMHRAFLIEALIERACRELIFVHGCSGILRHACVPMVADHCWVMRPHPRRPADGRPARQVAARHPARKAGRHGPSSVRGHRVMRQPLPVSTTERTRHA